MDASHKPLDGLLDRNVEQIEQADPEENFKEEVIDENPSLHPYQNLIIEGNEPSKPDFEEHEPVRSQKYERDEVIKKPNNGNREHSERQKKVNNIDSYEIAENMGKSIQRNNDLRKKSAGKSPHSTNEGKIIF